MTPRRWVTSDLHLEHANIIKYENRPFKDTEIMGATLTANWTRLVEKNDLVFVLGDFCFGSKEFTTKVLAALPGRKVLIKGNHDSHSTNWFRDVGFMEVSKWPIIVDRFFILSHEPMYLSVNSPYVNIHGHLHGTSLDDLQHFNVSVELHDYSPLDLDVVERTIRERVHEGQDLLGGPLEEDEGQE